MGDGVSFDEGGSDTAAGVGGTTSWALTEAKPTQTTAAVCPPDHDPAESARDRSPPAWWEPWAPTVVPSLAAKEAAALATAGRDGPPRREEDSVWGPETEEEGGGAAGWGWEGSEFAPEFAPASPPGGWWRDSESWLDAR